MPSNVKSYELIDTLAPGFSATIRSLPQVDAQTIPSRETPRPKWANPVPHTERGRPRARASDVESGTLVKPVPTMPADARALLRADATKLRGELATAAKRNKISVEAKAHIAESLALVDEALKAPIMKQSL